jgi:hypothetical protein
LDKPQAAAAHYIHERVLENPDNPRMTHYTPWEHVPACDYLVTQGYLVEDPFSRGSYGKGPKWGELVVRLEKSK